MKIHYLLFLITLFMAHFASAHTASDSYLSIQDKNDRLSIQWDIALRDLDFALGLDINRDSQLTGAEIKTRANEITGYSLAHLAINSGPSSCLITAQKINIIERNQQQYFSITSSSDCGIDESLMIDYQLFFDIDPTHRGIIVYQVNQRERNFIASGDNTSISINTDKQSPKDVLQVVGTFIIEGIWHIWIGLDHILFLLTLLLPVVLLSTSRQQITRDVKQPLWSIIKLVSCFTIAHSITLSLATLNIVTLPARWVEVTIAASIVVVALNNIKPLFNHSRLWFAFLFGLVHGFGFANVLLDLNLQPVTLALSLLSFNIGVELGQLMIILAVFPLLTALSYWVHYRKIFVPTMSVGFSLVAMVWVIERSTGYMLLGI